MVRYENLSHVFNYTWEHVIACFWKKYPNEHSTHVLTEDVLERRIIDGNKLYSKRLIGKTNPIPKWGPALLSHRIPKIAHVLEETIVDLSERSMVSYTWNINFRSIMDVKERVTLTGIAMNSTECMKEGWVDSSTTGLRRVLRKFGISRWKSNAQKAVLGYETTLVKFHGPSEDLSVDEKLLRLPTLTENTIETFKDVKDKAKTKAMDLATLASTKKAKKEPQNVS